MNGSGTRRVRPPAVAGAFYPAEPEKLLASLRAAFANAATSAPDAPAPKAIVVPHAGYVHSGAVAASAYLRLAPARDSIRRVVLVGPSHHLPFAGIAVTSADAFATPLGLVPVAAAARQVALTHPQVRLDDLAHAYEHSLEVQLPFLQVTLGPFELVPLAVGRCTTVAMAAVLDALCGGPETLIVVSTDLSHYHRYADAVALDARTAAAIVAAEPGAIGDRDACGAAGLRGLLHAATTRGLDVEQLDLRNSADTAGDPERVAGYGAFAVA
jgi:AmmeMemoRadiSam system protein B